MFNPFSPLSAIATLRDAETRSISAENPDGAKGRGGLASPGDDPSCTDAARELGRGWKVRPCLRNLEPGQRVTLADVQGPGVIQHIWFTVLHGVHRWIPLRVHYDDQPHPSIEVPVGDFFANGVNGSALINSIPIAVNPKGGMNSYWPMPFRKRIRIEIANDGHETIKEFFYQITYALTDVPDDAAYLHAAWRRSMTTREKPEHVILDRIEGRGHYVGTYLVWNQLSNQWWGEGEVKFFIDGDKDEGGTGATICGTGTEDYFGGAWGFLQDYDTGKRRERRPRTYSTAFLGYPQAVYGPDAKGDPRIPSHGLYRWHIPDPIHFKQDLRVTVQALGWWPGQPAKYQPLTDDIASTALWYQQLPSKPAPALPAINERFAR